MAEGARENKFLNVSIYKCKGQVMSGMEHRCIYVM